MREQMFGLVACSKSKRGEEERDREFRARKLYDSWLFNGRVEAVEAYCGEWAIMSAKHGYVEPEDKLTWYDKRITELSPEGRRELAESVVENLPETSEVMILMGRDYAEPLKAALPDEMEVWDPMEGVGLYELRSELDDLVEDAQETEQTQITDLI